MTITLSTHVLDLEAGRPAAGLAVVLDGPDGRRAGAVTDRDGRIAAWPDGAALAAGAYLLTFEVGAWFEGQDRTCFYPRVRIEFLAGAPGHYHVPLLLNRHGYTTYRGS